MAGQPPTARQKTERGHDHAEAFCVMKYRCGNCGTEERIWNSRDGVTPFIVSCSRCRTGRMEHVDWQYDSYEPDHIPRKGERMFVDTPESLRLPLTRMSIVMISRNMGETPDLDEKRVREIADHNYRKGSPYIVEA